MEAIAFVPTRKEAMVKEFLDNHEIVYEKGEHTKVTKIVLVPFKIRIPLEKYAMICDYFEKNLIILSVKG